MDKRIAKKCLGWLVACGVALGTAEALAGTETEEGLEQSRSAAAVAKDTLSVGRIYKLTGAPFTGNRLVLRAKAHGNLQGASYSWKRNGKEVAKTERLDIASLGAKDFGTYTLTVTTPLGTATSAGYVLEPAPAGVPASWSLGGYGEMPSPPAGVSGMVQITGAENLYAAVLSDGSAAVWGDDYGSGALSVPAGLSGVSQIAVGGGWGMQAVAAVKKNGTIAIWGTSYTTSTYWNDYAYSTYDPSTGMWTYTGGWVTATNGVDFAGLMPAGLSNVVKVALSGNYALALTADGNVIPWGSDFMMPALAIPEDLSDVVDIAAGSDFALAVTADGKVVQWGPSANGMLPPVPEDAFPAVAVAAGQFTGLALLADGTLKAWCNEQFDFGLGDVPVSDAGFTALASSGGSCAAALDAEGNVHAWGSAVWTEEDNMPAEVQGAALGIAVVPYMCTALVPDRDGDSIADALEPKYGRNPAVWEPWKRVTVGGKVTLDGISPAGMARVSLLDADGASAGRTQADIAGAWSIEGVLPGRYSLRVSADGAMDAVAEISTLDGLPVVRDIALAPGQATALAKVAPHQTADGRCGDACTEVQMPSGATVYLDMWPVKTTKGGTVDLGEATGGESVLDGTLLLPHAVTVKSPEPGAQTPAPAWLDGKAGDTVEANPHFTVASGSMQVTSTPSGAEVWVDYADEPLGVTPLTVTGLSAFASHSHTLLLKKDGYLRPRPVQFRVEAGVTTEINLPLTPAGYGYPEFLVLVSSALPGMEIYLDYLPTGMATPAVGSSWIGGLDPASPSGNLWYSASHSILLKHDGLRPFAPRAYPDTGLLAITAPNTYDDSDGDGVRNDREVAAGTNPFDPPAATVQSPVPVPHAWLMAHPEALAAAGADYEQAALADYDGDGMEAWREYVAGTDPENRADYFRVTGMTFEAGQWKVECNPRDDDSRTYQLEAASSADGEYKPVPSGGDEPGQRFYRVGVSLK